jgi:6-pyruvoyltetrahydropterin/6-carboxytetrahydropterin synthase
LKKNFLAYHHLPVQGPESVRHSHPYIVEATLQGTDLDENGFLLDISVLAINLEAILSKLEGRTLNDLHYFEEGPPTLENLCRVIWSLLSAALDRRGLEEMSVTIWESEKASASYRAGLRR